MGKEARDWAYTQPIRAPAKPVLVALAEHGSRCWPSVARLAEMTGYDARTVRRAIRMLEQSGFISVEHQPGRSALYHLKLSTTPDRESPLSESHPGQSDRTPRSESPVGAVRESGGAVRVTAEPKRTVKGTVNEPLRGETCEGEAQVDVRRDRQVGSGDELIFPAGLSANERCSAARLVARCNGEAQTVLDELAALMQAGSIRVSPLSCLRGLVRRAEEGTFVPEAGIRIAEARRKRLAAEAREARPTTDEVLREHARLLGMHPDEYVKRFAS